MAAQPYSQKILELGEKWLSGTITEEEKAVLFEWYDRFDDSELTLDPQEAVIFRDLKSGMLQDIRRQTSHAGGVRIMTKRGLAAAAAVLLISISGGYYMTRHSGKAVSGGLASTSAPAAPRQDIMPGSNKAVLTLDDGSTILLDSAGTGKLASQGNTQILKTAGGELKYAGSAAGAAGATAPMTYNVLSTPRGGQYKLALQDGTTVWLNAGSSIRYPAAFTGKERRVEVTGEAYFDIAKNAAMPFRVSVNGSAQQHGGADIEVLGTEFNVNAYKDEPVIRTTLVNGSVRLLSPQSSGLLKPSQHGLITPDGLCRTVPAEDIGDAIAWKSGAFEFNDQEISTVMRQIARWYDVEVVYEGRMPSDRFTGRFSRSTSLAGVLKILNISGVKLIAENKKIIMKS